MSGSEMVLIRGRGMEWAQKKDAWLRCVIGGSHRSLKYLEPKSTQIPGFYYKRLLQGPS